MTWTTDDSFKFHLVSKYIGPYYDAIGTTYEYRVPDYKAAGIDGVYLTQWAANSHWLREPKPARDCRYPVSFIGMKYGSRAETVAKLKAAGIEVACFGFNWQNGPIATEEIPEVMHDSIISLNFSTGFRSDSGNLMQIKARSFEVPGAGGFLLTDSAPGLDAVYSVGEEIETYVGFAELERKIKHYLQHPEERDRIANAGYTRTASFHTYEKRLEGLLKFALERRRVSSQNIAASEVLDGKTALESLPSPQLGITLHGVRIVLVGMCSVIWGRERGLNAARRLVFKVSERIFGARTFSAYSLPGRMFPYV